MQVTTLYSSYDEYNIDMDILGKVVSIPQLSRDELKEIVFKELQETHPIPKLEDERYKLSRPVDEDYKVQVENYVQQFEDEDLSVDELGEDEDPYNRGTDKEDIYAIGDIYGLDINIFSSPFTEDEVEQATKDIESFLSQKVRRFKQNKAEYEKESVVSLEELRAMYQTRVHIQTPEEQDDEVMEDTISLEEKEAVSEEQADEVMEDTLSLEEKEEVPEEEEGTKEVVSDEQEGTDENYFISEPSIPFIRVLIPFISEPDVPCIEVRCTVEEKEQEEQPTDVGENEQPIDVEEKERLTDEVVQEPTFIEEPPVDYIQVTTETNPLVQEKERVQESKSPEVTFIEEPPVDFIQISNSTPENSNAEIESTDEVAYFVDEPSIPYIVVSSSTVESLNQGTASDENSDFFIEEPDISFINVYSSENQEYSEEGDDSDSDFTYEGSDEDDQDAYEMDADDEGYDGDEGEDEDDTYDVEDDSVDEEDEEEGTYDEEDEDDSYDEEGYDEEPEEEDEEDDSTVEAEEDGTYDAGDISYDEEDTDSSGDDSVEEYDDSLEGYEEDFEGEDDSVGEEDGYSEGYDEDDDASTYEMMTDSEDLDGDVMSYESEDDSTVEEEEHTTPTPIPQAVKVPSKPVVPEQEIQVKPRASALTKRVHKTNPEPVVQSSKTSVTPQVKEKKGSDTLSSKKVSESLDLEVSFMNKSKVTDTKPKASTSGIEITRVPKDLVEFLRLYPRTPYKVAVQYFGEKEVKRQLKMGRVYQNGKYLVI